jgi:hypothetical protein
LLKAPQLSFGDFEAAAAKDAAALLVAASGSVLNFFSGTELLAIGRCESQTRVHGYPNPEVTRFFAVLIGCGA